MATSHNLPSFDLHVTQDNPNFDGPEGDSSYTSNNTTTPPPLPTIALNPPTFQELPPLPLALQRPCSPDKDCEDIGATADERKGSIPPTNSKPQSFKNSIGLLKKEMKCLRSADLDLLCQLNELHEQILSYKAAMNERLERQSETNSEYSNSLTEEYDDDLGEEMEEGEEGQETDVSNRLQSLVLNGEAGAVGGSPLPQSQSQKLSPTAPRSLHQLRQQLPPPPPRPSVDQFHVGNSAVHNWLDLNFKSDSYNC